MLRAPASWEARDGVRDAPQILTVGSTQAWHALIREQLRNALVDTEATGRGATLRARDGKPDLVIVEAVLADMSGIAFCRSLREDPGTRHLRVLMISEQNSELDRVLAFECGADDFIAAPFSPRELGARVNALLRRDSSAPSSAPLPRPEQHGIVLVHADLGKVEVAGRAVRLTPTEFRVFSILLVGRGKVLTRRAIVEGLSGEPGARSTRVVDAHVKALRKKLGAAGGYIQSVRGVGYRFAVPGR